MGDRPPSIRAGAGPCRSVRVSVVLVRHVRVGMPLRIVAMHVAVQSDRHNAVRVGVMPIAVAVRMLVLLGAMSVLVRMTFCKV
jgi:hypothetical protein